MNNLELNREVLIVNNHWLGSCIRRETGWRVAPFQESTKCFPLRRQFWWEFIISCFRYFLLTVLAHFGCQEKQIFIHFDLIAGLSRELYWNYWIAKHNRLYVSFLNFISKIPFMMPQKWSFLQRQAHPSESRGKSIECWRLKNWM